MNLTGLDKMKQARSRLMISNIFFGSAAISLTFKEDRTQPTAWTDGKTLAFNPDFTDPLPMDQLETLVCHEVLHCILQHPLRLRGRDHETANHAMDYTVNGITKRAGLRDIPNALYSDELSNPGRSFEMNYETLKGKEEEKKQQQQNQQQPDPDKPQDKPGTTADQPGEGPGNGKPQQGEGEPQQTGDVREPKTADGKPISEAEAAQIEANWKVTACKAAQAAEQAGQGTGELRRLVETLTVKQRDLEDVLRDFLSAAITSDYSYRRPNKKHIIHDLYMPSIDGNEIPKIVMVMDTSGSIGEAEISYFQAKLNSILSEFRTTIQILYCDTTAHDGGEYTQNDQPVALKPIGGGGTDFRPPFAWIRENDLQPTCMIYYTDGYSSRFPDEPDFPVLWALYGRPRRFPFGETVNIDPTRGGTH